MKKIVILASDTIHRRYFISKIISSGIAIHSVIFEKESIKAPFETGPFLQKEEEDFETEHFFKVVNRELTDTEVKYVSTINSLECQEYLSDVKPDFALVFGTRKVAQRFMILFLDKGINVHRGIAEEYRGLDTNMWAVYHNDFENVGVTIHRIDDSLDTGEIIFQEKLVYPDNVKAFEMRYYETLLSTDLSIKALKQYLNGNLVSRKQTKTGRYYSFMPLVLKQLLPKRLEKYANQ